MQNKSIESILTAISLLQKQTPLKVDSFFNPPLLSNEQCLQNPKLASIVYILKQYPVKRAALFGSVARNEMSETSDIDMLVEFHPGASGLDFYGLGGDLEDALKCHVDLLTWASLRDAKRDFAQNVINDARLIYES